MIHILFVDDEPNILLGLSRMLRCMRNVWQMEFVGSGPEALARMEQDPFDVIVSDMRMPQMNGVQLFNEVRERYPATARVILSGQAEENMIIRTAGNTHQYLTKPCDEATLKDAINRTCAMRELLQNLEIRNIVSRAQSLPSLPTIYEEIVEAVNSNEVSLSKVGELIARDMAMSSKVLQLINSAFFGTPRRVVSITEAVGLLGIDTIRALVSSEGVFSEFPKDRMENPPIGDMWRHSARTAVIARAIAREERLDSSACEEAFTAAFLHDIGNLILALKLPDQYAESLAIAERESFTLWQAETHVFGTSHAEIGAYLLSLWGLPASLIHAIAWHHIPEFGKEGNFGAITAVHVANALEHATAGDWDREVAIWLDMEYLDCLGMADRIPIWREIAAGCTGVDCVQRKAA